jgi:GTP-binding protein
MKIEFIKSCSDIIQLPNDNFKEYCFIGRSNVGKSTLINAIANNSVARTSNTPGRTQLINLFSLGNNKRLIDLPGYGFARVGIKNKENMDKMVDDYILTRKNLSCIFQICDIGVITPQDKEVNDYIKDKNHFLILNKIDRYSNNQINNTINKIIKFFEIKKEKIILVSAKKRIGIEKIFKQLL